MWGNNKILKHKNMTIILLNFTTNLAIYIKAQHFEKYKN